MFTAIIKCGIKSLNRSKTSMVQLFKFGDGLAISSHTFLHMWLLMHAQWD